MKKLRELIEELEKFDEDHYVQVESEGEYREVVKIKVKDWGGRRVVILICP